MQQERAIHTKELAEWQEGRKREQTQHEKERAVQLQQLDFQEVQIKDLKEQLAESRRNHEAMLKALDEAEGSSTTSGDAARSEVEALLESHKQELRLLQEQAANTEERLEHEVERASEQK